MTNAETKWDAEGYRNVVLGTGCADQVVHEFDLTPDAVDQLRRDPDGTIEAWLYRAEADAWDVGGLGRGPQPAEWEAFHADALERLTAAASRRAVEVA